MKARITITARQVFVAAVLIALGAWATETAIDYTNRRINGNLTVVGTTTMTGAQTLTGTTTLTTVNATTLNTASLDAGAVFIRGNAQVAGTIQNGTKVDVLDAGVARFNGSVQIAGTNSNTTCTLGGQSPSICTATVLAGSTCICGPVGASAAIAAGGCAVGLSGTTLTATSANGLTNVVNIHCF